MKPELCLVPDLCGMRQSQHHRDCSRAVAFREWELQYILLAGVYSVKETCMLGRIKPSSLRGDLRRSRFFEGWFQKVYSTQHQASFVIIYGYATQNSYDTCGFIQLHVPNAAPQIIYFPQHDISLDANQHIVRMGDNVLTTEMIDINTADITINLSLLNNKPIQTFGNSMGYSYYVPSLPCYHSVLNTSHRVSGRIRHKASEYTLNDEMGYLEKNWGTSFPEHYFWLHAVDPTDPSVSLLFSRADIRWLGQNFLKHVGHIRFDDKQIDLRQLKNFAVSSSIPSSNKRVMQITSKALELEIAITSGQKVLLKGPRDGTLSRDILHYADAMIDLHLLHEGTERTLHLVGNFEHIGSVGLG
jgi:tocopherol cyclase